jgi:hypothetical protein
MIVAQDDAEDDTVRGSVIPRASAGSRGAGDDRKHATDPAPRSRRGMTLGHLSLYSSTNS